MPESPTVPSAWKQTLRRNLLLPLLILAMWPLGSVIEHSPCTNPYYARILLLIGINVILAVSLQFINGLAGQFSLGHAGFMAVGAYMAGYPTATFTPDFATVPAAANPFAVLAFYAALLGALGVAAGVMAAAFAVIRRGRRLHPWLPLAATASVCVWFVWDIKVAWDLPGPRWYLVWSGGLTLLKQGYEWLLHLGQDLAPALNDWVPDDWRRPGTFIVALVGGGCVAALAGLVVGLPSLRLRGDYLAIATLGFAEIIRVAVINSAALGKATGLSVPVYSMAADLESGGTGTALRIFPWVYSAMLVTICVAWRLAHSAKGRALQAVREDEIAAAAIGISTTHHKVLAFVMGAFFAGVAGGLYAHYDGYLNPNSFGLMRSIEIVVMVTLGGLGSISGAVAAGAVLTWLPEFLRSPADWLVLVCRPLGAESAEALHLPAWLMQGFTTVGENRMVFYSALLIGMMLVRPRGLLGGRELWRRPRPVPVEPDAAPAVGGGEL